METQEYQIRLEEKEATLRSWEAQLEIRASDLRIREAELDKREFEMERSRGVGAYPFSRALESRQVLVFLDHGQLVFSIPIWWEPKFYTEGKRMYPIPESLRKRLKRRVRLYLWLSEERRFVSWGLRTLDGRLFRSYFGACLGSFKIPEEPLGELEVLRLADRFEQFFQVLPEEGVVHRKPPGMSAFGYIRKQAKAQGEVRGWAAEEKEVKRDEDGAVSTSADAWATDS